jgi:hypothetical protein
MVENENQRREEKYISEQIEGVTPRSPQILPRNPYLSRWRHSSMTQRTWTSK